MTRTASGRSVPALVDLASTPFVARAIRKVAHAYRPDVVHALRIPYEGMWAARATAPDCALVISVWGNDFTLHAKHSRMVSRETRRAVSKVDALIADCRRDIELASQFGLAPSTPTAVIPGSGGIDSTIFSTARHRTDIVGRLGLDDHRPMVINPRGKRSYVRTDTFIRSIPLVLAAVPSAQFVAVGLADDRSARRLARALNVESQLTMTGSLQPEEVADLLASSQVSVSLSVHDGIPNTLLEAMAAGTVPVVGDVASVRELISDGTNGLIVSPDDCRAVADRIAGLLVDASAREPMREMNLEIAARHTREAVRPRIKALYETAIENSRRPR